MIFYPASISYIVIKEIQVFNDYSETSLTIKIYYYFKVHK